MCRDKIQKQKFDKCKDEDKCEEKGKSWSAGDQSKQASCLNACMTVGVKDEQILAQARALGRTGRVRGRGLQNLKQKSINQAFISKDHALD